MPAFVAGTHYVPYTRCQRQSLYHTLKLIVKGLHASINNDPTAQKMLNVGRVGRGELVDQKIGKGQYPNENLPYMQNICTTPLFSVAKALPLIMVYDARAKPSASTTREADHYLCYF